MLNQIRLKNFQGHRESTIDFCDGVNVVVGESDSGKSSIIRALNWVLTNKPRGNSFINEKANSVSVDVKMDGIVINRQRTDKSTGSYKVGKSNYSVMGNDIPEEALRVLNLSDINLQAQLDTHFLILDTPGKVAQYLNGITKLDKLTDASDKLRSKHRESKRELDTIVNDIQGMEEYLNSGVVEILEELISIYDKVVAIADKRDVLIARISEIKRILVELKKIEESNIPVDKVDELEELLSDIGIKISQLEELKNKYNEVHRILIHIKSVDKILKEDKTDLKLGEIELVKIKKQLTKCPYCGQVLTEKAKGVLLNG